MVFFVSTAYLVTPRPRDGKLKLGGPQRWPMFLGVSDCILVSRRFSMLNCWILKYSQTSPKPSSKLPMLFSLAWHLHVVSLILKILCKWMLCSNSKIFPKTIGFAQWNRVTSVLCMMTMSFRRTCTNQCVLAPTLSQKLICKGCKSCTKIEYVVSSEQTRLWIHLRSLLKKRQTRRDYRGTRCLFEL